MKNILLFLLVVSASYMLRAQANAAELSGSVNAVEKQLRNIDFEPAA